MVAMPIYTGIKMIGTFFPVFIFIAGLFTLMFITGRSAVSEKYIENNNENYIEDINENYIGYKLTIYA